MKPMKTSGLIDCKIKEIEDEFLREITYQAYLLLAGFDKN